MPIKSTVMFFSTIFTLENKGVVNNKISTEFLPKPKQFIIIITIIIPKFVSLRKKSVRLVLGYVTEILKFHTDSQKVSGEQLNKCLSFVLFWFFQGLGNTSLNQPAFFMDDIKTVYMYRKSLNCMQPSTILESTPNPSSGT